MANEKDNYGMLLPGLIAGSDGGDESALRAFLASHSNLPGPRANLELLDAYSTAIGELSRGRTDPLWKLSLRLRQSADEFVAMCGVRGIGAIGRSDPSAFAEKALSQLRLSSTHRSWRVREAVAMALQDMIESDPQTVERLEEWIHGGDWLEMRAVAAGVAEPRLLRRPNAARSAVRLHQAIFERILSVPAPRSGEFRVLRQALAYSLSVVVAALPDEGFSWMERLITKRDPDVLWICRENLKKNRLTSRFPDEVKAMTVKANR
jgi:hypothetical protein